MGMHVRTVQCALFASVALALGASPAAAMHVSLPPSAIVGVPEPGANSVEISVDDASGKLGAVFRVQFDAAKVSIEPGDVETIGAADGCALEVNTQSPTNQVRISMACTHPLDGGGPLVRMTFSGDAAGTSPLTFVACQFDEDAPSACQTSNGQILVTDCALNVDGKGATASGITDGVYIYRALIGLGKVVPDLHRTQDPTIPSDAVIAARVASIAADLNVDGKNGTLGITDGVYVYRHLIGLGKIVPDLHRSQDPTIPSDAIVGANIDASCP